MLTLLMVLNLGVNIKDDSVSVTSKSTYAVVEKRDAKCNVCTTGITLECIEGKIGYCTPLTTCTPETCGES